MTLAFLAAKEIDRRKAAFYLAVQFAGGFLGMLVAHLMFYGTASTYYPDTSILITVSSNVKLPAQYFAEFVGTFLLVGVIFGCVRGGSKSTGLSVALVVGGMLVTTSSTMFANPTVTFARMFTYAICGIAPESAIPFMIAEVIGAVSAAAVFGYVYPINMSTRAKRSSPGNPQ